MRIISNPLNLQKEILELKRQGKTIGFVPTMGNLHAGHLSLIDRARQETDLVVASIFVNPMQFGPSEDFASYPRTLDADIKKLKHQGTDILLTPSNEAIYPQGNDQHTSVEVNRLTDKLCGARRPGHFRGVTTVVNILFNIVQPDVAVFGKKDYQQLCVIERMVQELMLPVKIIGAEIKREANGLAMSSRNGYLSTQEKEQASLLRKTIIDAANAIKNHHDIAQTIQHSITKLECNQFKVDYFNVVRREDLENASLDDKHLLIAAAAWLGQPRLIDNLEIDL
jgi:pantoate--beta-alanine ligase